MNGLGLGLALEAAQRTKLATGDWLRAGRAALATGYMQNAALEVDLIPAQADKLGGSQAVPEGNEDHRRIAMPVPVIPGSRD